MRLVIQWNLFGRRSVQSPIFHSPFPERPRSPADHPVVRETVGPPDPRELLACISHYLTVEARNRPVIPSLRLPAVLTVLAEINTPMGDLSPVPGKRPPPPDQRTDDGIVEAPTRLRGILRQVGPGLIIAGTVVGSGELIATTKTGAQAGIDLLWLIILACLIKVFVQIEIGRHTITHGETTLSALNRLPGPRLRVNWLIWYWFVMMAANTGGMGAIVGGVGQALALAFPITGDYSRAIQLPSELELKRYIAWKGDIDGGGAEFGEDQRRRARADSLGANVVPRPFGSAGSRWRPAGRASPGGRLDFDHGRAPR